MNRWPVVSLSEALSTAEVFTDGDWVESKDQDPAGNVRLVQLADVGDGEYVDKSARFLTSAKATQLKCTPLKKGDVLVARMPDPLGRACIFPGDPRPSVTVVDVCIIRPNGGIHPVWLMHCLNSPSQRAQMAQFTTGTTRSRISRSNLAKVRMALPSLEEQVRIADVLDRANVLRAKRRAALGQLDSLSESIFLELFGEPARNTKMLPTVSLGELGVWQSGGTPSRQCENYFKGDTPWFSSGELNEMYVYESNERISTTALRDSPAKAVQKGALLLGMYDTAALKASIAGVNCSCNQAIAFASINEDRALPLYVYFAIRIGREQYRRLQRGVRQKNLNLSMIRDIRIPLPSLGKQSEFTRLVGQIERLKSLHIISLKTLNELFNSLQHRVFEGQLCV